MPTFPYNIINTRSEQVFLTAETAFGTYVLPTNTDACRLVSCNLTPMIPLLVRRDKTGTLSQTSGIKGRIHGQWSIEMDLAGNGVAGNAPDCAILLNAAMGQTPTGTTIVAISAAVPSGGQLRCTGPTTNMQTGEVWFILGVSGTNFVSTVSYPYIVTVVDATHFDLVGSVATGSYTVASASASITGKIYTSSDANYTFDLWSFRNSNGTVTSTMEQRVAGSCIVTQLDISFGGDFATLRASGDCLCVLDNNYFSSASVAEKGGLSSFPTVPTAPVTNGYPSAGFIQTANIDGLTIAEIKTGTISINTGRKLIRDSFGSYVPTGVEAAERSVSVSFDTDDTDSSSLVNLKNKSKLKTTMPWNIQLGAVPGSIFFVGGAALQLDPPAITDGAIRYSNKFSGRSFATNYTSKDEVHIVAA